MNLNTLWNRQGGYKEVLITAFPLILSTASWSILQFIDRMFLAWYSPEAVAASMPAGILNFTLTSLFIGTAGYIGTFVAQYYGASEHKMIGKTLFQGVLMALAGAFIIFFFGFASDSFFSVIGHPVEIMKLESIYFKILCFPS